MTILLERLSHADALVLHEFLDAEECRHFIELSEASGYADAPVTTATGFVMMKEYRNNDRVIVDDRELAGRLWRRARPFLPSSLTDGYGVRMEAVGLNERLRFYRYRPGQTFRKHYDGCYRRPNGDEMSLLTFMVYLDGGCEGGETVFYDEDVYPAAKKLAVRPERGKALVFPHPVLHEGAIVTSGVKYVLRTDVMFGYPTL